MKNLSMVFRLIATDAPKRRMSNTIDEQRDWDAILPMKPKHRLWVWALNISMCLLVGNLY